MPSEPGEKAFFRLLMARIISSDEINIALSGNITLAGKQDTKFRYKVNVMLWK